MTEKLYPRCFHPWDLEPHYSKHVSAMTTENLHHKADIAEQLAWRDKRILDLESELKALSLDATTVALAVDPAAPDSIKATARRIADRSLYRR